MSDILSGRLEFHIPFPFISYGPLPCSAHCFVLAHLFQPLTRRLYQSGLLT